MANLVECWLSTLTTKRLSRGSFANIPDLRAAIREYIQVNNKSAEPFVWRPHQLSPSWKSSNGQAICRTDHRRTTKSPAIRGDLSYLAE